MPTNSVSASRLPVDLQLARSDRLLGRHLAELDAVERRLRQRQVGVGVRHVLASVVEHAVLDHQRVVAASGR